MSKLDELLKDPVESGIARVGEILRGGAVWEVEHFNDLSAVWLVLQGGDWHACVEQSRRGSGVQYDAWLDVEDAVGVLAGGATHVGPFDSIEAARRTANAMASQWLIENDRMDEALALGETLPASVRQGLRNPEDLALDVPQPDENDELEILIGFGDVFVEDHDEEWT